MPAGIFLSRPVWLGILILAAGCGGSPPRKPAPHSVCGKSALEETRALVDLGLRDSGTQGAQRAAEYIARRLSELGVDSEIQAFREGTPRGETTFRNVIGRLPGNREGIIVLGAHYDTKSGMPSGFEGANDSGSGVGLLLELARTLASGPSIAPETWFVFFDGEECMEEYADGDGLHGSKALARRLLRENLSGEVRMVLVLDMIGDRDLNIGIPRNGSPSLHRLARQAIRAEGLDKYFRSMTGAILDDHVPFLAAGMPALLFIDFEYGPEEGSNAWWHTEEDTLDKLSPESLEITGRVVLRMLSRLQEDAQAHSP